MSNKSQSRKNKFHTDNAKRQIMSIVEYVERKMERKNAPGKILNGEMFVMLHGHWVTKKEFDKYLPEPIVHSFNHDITNVDNSGKWVIL
jgi:hypothetical protein